MGDPISNVVQHEEEKIMEDVIDPILTKMEKKMGFKVTKKRHRTPPEHATAVNPNAGDGKKDPLKIGYWGSRQINRHIRPRKLPYKSKEMRIDMKLGLPNFEWHASDNCAPVACMPFHQSVQFWELFPNGIPHNESKTYTDYPVTSVGRYYTQQNQIATNMFKDTDANTNWTELDIPQMGIKVICNQLRINLANGASGKDYRMRLLVIRLPKPYTMSDTGAKVTVGLNAFTLGDFFKKAVDTDDNPIRVTSFMKKDIHLKNSKLEGFQVLVDRSWTMLNQEARTINLSFNYPHGTIKEDDMVYQLGAYDLASVRTDNALLADGRIVWGIFYEPICQDPLVINAPANMGDIYDNIKQRPHFYGDYKFKFVGI